MAHFSVASNGVTEVVIAAASTGNRARFLNLTITGTASIFPIHILDGAGGTTRATLNVPVNNTYNFRTKKSGQSIFPKSWFTAGNAIVFKLTGGAANHVISGELVREP